MLRRGFWDHLFPREVSVRALHWSTTYGLGLFNISLIFLLALTGAVLAVYYVPAPHLAYASVTDIDHVVPYGRLLRSVHRWGAHALVLFTLLHWVRVWAAAAYRGRGRNWIYGTALGICVAGLSFTGYLLVWDQRGYWAVRIVTEILASIPGLGPMLRDAIAGGPFLGAASLTRFYAGHVLWLPVVTTLLVALHLFRVRSDGAARLIFAPEPVVPAVPHLTRRFAAVLLVTVAVLVLVALVWPSPLDAPADLVRPDNPAKAPWFFLALQEAVSYSALWGACIGPAFVLAVVAAKIVRVQQVQERGLQGCVLPVVIDASDMITTCTDHQTIEKMILAT